MKTAIKTIINYLVENEIDFYYTAGNSLRIAPSSLTDGTLLDLVLKHCSTYTNNGTYCFLQF